VCSKGVQQYFSLKGEKDPLELFDRLDKVAVGIGNLKTECDTLASAKLVRTSNLYPFFFLLCFNPVFRGTVSSPNTIAQVFKIFE